MAETHPRPCKSDRAGSLPTEMIGRRSQNYAVCQLNERYRAKVFDKSHYRNVPSSLAAWRATMNHAWIASLFYFCAGDFFLALPVTLDVLHEMIAFEIGLAYPDKLARSLRFSFERRPPSSYYCLPCTVLFTRLTIYLVLAACFICPIMQMLDFWDR